MKDVHAPLVAKQGPYAALAAAYPGLKDLPAPLASYQSGKQYLEVSTSFASPDPARYEACAPVAVSAEAVSAEARGSGSADVWADCTLLDAAPQEEREAYGAALHSFIAAGKGQPAPGSAPLLVSFRLASKALPDGAAAPWVRCSWQPATECDPPARQELHQLAVAVCARKAAKTQAQTAADES